MIKYQYKYRILITGSGGLVGQNLSNVLKKHKFTIFTPTRKQLDLKYYDQLITYITKNKINFVIHCASLVGGILDNINKRIDYLITNIEINKNVILASYNSEVPYLINIGSSCMYPRDVDGYLSEEMIFDGNLEPTNEGHALSKLFSVKLCNFISEDNNYFLYKSLIPCNLYGDYDNFDLQTSHFIPALIRKVFEAKKNKNKNVFIWGDKKTKREIMHVLDLADAILFSIKNIEKLPGVINVGTGKDYTIQKYYNIASEVIKYKCDWKYDLSKPIGMKRKVMDVTKINKLGWKSKINIYDGFKRTLNFYSKNYKNNYIKKNK